VGVTLARQAATTNKIVDGRNARRDRNRELVVDAALELFNEGHLEPNALDVAERSGVSERSVFRYFEDRDALLRAAVDRHLERTNPLFEIPGLGEGPLAERIDRCVAHRMKLYGVVAPTARAAVRRAPSSPVIRNQLDTARRRLRAQLEAMFAPELAAMPAAPRRATIAVADTLFQFESVEYLREHLRLPPARAAESLRRALTALFRA
jgi:AcrR family transcriptional regulator